jgi:hypothetical protein
MFKRFYYVLLILFFTAAWPLADRALAANLDDLETRIEINEARLDDVEGGFKTFMDISGYFAMMYISTDKQNMVDRFRLHHVNLLFDKEVAEGWNFHSEIEFEDGTRLEGDGNGGLESGKDQGAVILETLYVDARVNDYLTLRIGRYLDPAGIWNVDHYAPFVPTMIRPQIVSNKVFPDTLDGLQAFGNRPLGDEHVGEYHLYVANGFGESGKTDSNEEKAVGGSFNLKFLSFYDLNIGVSVFSGRDSNQKERDAQGFDVQFRVKDLSFQAEYATADLKPVSGATTEKSGWYGQFEYDINKLSLVYRYDIYEDTSLATNKEMIVNTAGVNYHFTTNIVAKLENHWHKPENTEKYTMTVATLAIFFGG